MLVPAKVMRVMAMIAAWIKEKSSHHLSATWMMLMAFASSALGADLPYDIIGIHIGDTIEQAREKIQQFDPRIKVVSSRWTAKPGLPTSTSHLFGLVNNTGGNRSGFDGGWRSYVNGASYNDFVQVTLGQLTQSVHSIVRRSGNENKNPMLLSTLQSALVDKYGNPHAQRSGSLIWAFGENGQPVKNTELCDISAVDDMDEGRLLLRSNPDCGLVIQATYILDSPTVVSSYQVAMLDYWLLVKDIGLREEQEKAWVAQEKERKMNEITNNKPRL